MMGVRLWTFRCKNLINTLQVESSYLHGKPCRSMTGLSTQRQTHNTDPPCLHESAKEDFKKRGFELFKAIQCKGMDSYGYSEKHLTSLYQYLLDIGIKPSSIEAQFLETPDLGKYSLETWKKVCETLVKNGVPSDSVFRNIALCPHLLKFNSNLLEQHVKRYSEMQIGKQSILEIAQRNPQLYMCPPRAIRRQIGMLSALFPPAELKNLIKNNPNILTEDWNTVSEKIMYIHEVMGLEQPHIAASESLQKSLLHLKTRHQFLYRAGLYITPNLLRDKRSDKKNANLSLIMDTSNKYFTNKIARLTDYEYDVFCNIMKEEHDFIASDSELSDSDSDLDIDSLN